MKIRLKKKGLSTLIVIMLLCTIMVSSAFSGIFLSGIEKGPVASGVNNSIVKKDGNHDLSQLDEDVVEKIETISDEDYVNYIIRIDEDTTLSDLYEKRINRNMSFQEYVVSRSARIHAENIEKTQAAFFKQISKQVDMRLVATNNTLVNAITVSIKYKNRDELSRVAGKSGALSVSLSNTYDTPLYDEVDNEVPAWDTGIFKRPEDKDGQGNLLFDFQGEGMLVAVLDTGLDHTHAAFSEDNLPADKSKLKDMDYIESLLPALTATKGYIIDDRMRTIEHATAADFYVNQKVPYAFDYADFDLEVNTTEENMHGTHVSGIIVGRSADPKDKDGNEVYDPAGKVMTGIEGVAPLAQIVSMKVFKDHQGGTEDAYLIPALEDCYTLGVDVINMSLGMASGLGEDENPTLAAAYNAIGRKGISLVTAAGNSYSSATFGQYGLNLASNPDSGVIASPSSFDMTFAVASIQGIKQAYFKAISNANAELGIAYINEASNPDAAYGYNSYNFVDDIYKAVTSDPDYAKYYDDNTGIIKVPYVSVPGIGSLSDCQNAKVSGKIALIRRGKNTFIEKLTNAKIAGAIAGIIHNNVNGIIGMSIDDTVGIPACSITMASAASFKDVNGFIEIKIEKVMDKDGTSVKEVKSLYKAGPFMSDFSSWGALSDLTLKPEITGHGGEIYSAAPGKDNYARISGTSMAAPNIAGLVTIGRQALQENPAKYGLYEDGSTSVIDKNKLEDRVYQLMMSTATIPLNEESSPYSPRKIGAGLADIGGMLRTNAFLYVADQNGLDGMKDRTKIELKDDKERTGIYEAEFYVRNLGAAPQSYKLSSIVMTERLSIDKKTVSEMSKLLNPQTEEWWIGESETPVGNDKVVTVNAKSDLKIKVKFTLSESDKKTLGDSFKNGMFIEGFFRLEAVKNVSGQYVSDESGVDLGVPYLAFFGDWLDAPMFDNSVYDVDKDAKDNNISDENKTYATVNPLQIWGKIVEDGSSYLMPLSVFSFYVPDRMFGQYVDFSESVPYATPERTTISLSQVAASEIYYVTGFLRAAKTVEWDVKNKVTGQIMGEGLTYNARKDAKAGNIGGPCIEFNPLKKGCKINVTYTITLRAKLDYPDAETEEVAMDFIIDGDAPIITNSEVRVERNSQNEYERYLDFYIHDDNFAQALNFELYDPFLDAYTSIFDRGLMPLVCDKNSITKVSFSLTRVWEKLKENGYEQDGVKEKGFKICVRIYDTSFNMSFYEINLDDMLYTYATGFKFGDIGVYSEYVNSQGIGKKILTGATEKIKYDESGKAVPMTEITVRPNQTMKLDLALIRENANVWVEDLEWTSNNPSVVRVNPETGEIFAVGFGTARITVKSVKNPNTTTASLLINVLATEEISDYMDESTGYKLNPIGNNMADFNDVKIKNYSKELRAGETYEIEAQVLPWFADTSDVTVTWSSDLERVATVEVDPNNQLKAVVTAKSGTYEADKYVDNYSDYTRIVVTATSNTIKSKRYSYSIDIYVRKEFLVEGGTLTRYNGSAAEVYIPESLNIKTIGNEAFADREDITKVVVPEGVEKIGHAAFAYMNNLKEVRLPSTIKTIDEWAFAAKTTLAGGVTTALNILDTSLFDQPVHIANRAFQNQRALGTDLSMVNLSPNSLPWTSTQIQSGIPKLYSSDYSKFDTKSFRSIGMFSFYNCTFISDLDLSGVRHMSPLSFAYTGQDAAQLAFGSPARYGNYFLDITFSKDTQLGTESFVYAGVQKLNLPMRRIPSYAFRLSLFLDEITFEAEAEGLIVESSAFDIAFVQLTNGGQAVEKPNPGKINFNCNAEYIGDWAFSNPTAPSLEITQLNYNGHTIRHIGSGAFFATQLPETFTLPGGLEYLGQDAFSATPIVTLVIPENLTALVGLGQAFYYAPDFKYVTVAAGNTKYSTASSKGILSETDVLIYNTVGEEYEMVLIPNGKELTEFTVPDKITTLGAGAFGFNLNLETIDLGKVRKVDPFTLAFMPSLKQVRLSSNMTEIPEGMFLYSGKMLELSRNNVKGSADNVLTITNTSHIVTVGDNAFNNSAIQTIDLSGCTSIGEYAFAQSNLKSFTIPRGVTEIADYTFYGMKDFSSVTFHSGVEIIGAYAFAGILGRDKDGNDDPSADISNKLTTIDNFTGGVEIIKEGAFSLCESLGTVAFSSATMIGDFAFYARSGKGNLVSAGIGSALTIGMSAFENQRLPYSVNLNYVTDIGVTAFANTEIRGVSLRNVERIESGAFYDCKNLTGTFTVQSAVEYIAPLAFSNTKLSAFAVAGNDRYMADVDGVLFKIYDNGTKELAIFPANSSKVRNTYEVPEGTVRIAEYAFANIENITFITLPSTLVYIGHKAFYDSTISTYRFKSFAAPILEAEIIAANMGDQNVYYWASYANFYSNFSPEGIDSASGYFSQAFRYNTVTAYMLTDTWRSSGGGAGANGSITGGGDFSNEVKYGLVMIRPGNGLGYDDFIYGHYFDSVVLDIDTMEANTQRIVGLINDLPAVSAIVYEWVIQNLSEIQDVRKEYDRLTIGQKALIGDSGVKLAAVESRINQLLNLAVKYEVIFMIDGKLEGIGQTVYSGQKATKPADPFKSGYSFVGWFVDGVEFDFDKPVGGTVILTGKFTSGNTVTVTFTGEGADDIPAQDIESGERAEKPADPVREGYKFNGWYAGNTKYDFDTPVNSDLTLTANWTKEGGCKNCGTIGAASDGSGLLFGLLMLSALIAVAVVLVVKKRTAKGQ